MINRSAPCEEMLPHCHGVSNIADADKPRSGPGLNKNSDEQELAQITERKSLFSLLVPPVQLRPGQPPGRKSLNQFRHGLTSISDQVLRTACEVREGYLADVDAKVLVKRGEHFAKL